MINFSIRILVGFGFVFLSLISCEEALFEPKLSEEKVTLLLPTNETKTFDQEVKFEWLKVEGANRYQIQLAFPDFEKTDFIVFDRIVDTIFVNDSLRKIGKYEWRVRALSGADSTLYTTSTIELIKNPSFEFQQVNLIAPANNELSKSLVNNISWQAIEEADSYEIQILNTSSEIISKRTTTNTSFEITFPEGESTWQIRAIKDENNTSFSKNTIIVDTKPPIKPNLTAPLDQSTIAQADLEFSWNRTAVSGSMEKDSIYIYTDAAKTDLKLKAEASSPFKTSLEVATYYWNITAFDEAGNQSEVSDCFSVTIN